MNLEKVTPLDRETSGVRVVVETPRGSRLKIKYLPDCDAFMVDRVLPLGTTFPAAFGFVPQTLGDDGDPLDVLVIADEPIATGCLVLTRLVGVILATQRSGRGRAERNDRLIGVPVQDVAFRTWKSLESVGGSRLNAIEQFFVSYHELQGRTFHPVGRAGPRRARALLMEGIRRGAKE